MKTTARTIIAIAALATLTPAPTNDTVSAAETGTEITIANGTEAERTMTRWALGRYEAAGLELPAMSITFHDDTEACSGFIGLYSAQAGEVRICNRGEYETESQHTMLHELAHAWSFANLIGTDVDRFNSHRGLDHWINEQGPWWKQGAEQVAEIVAWGLQDPADPFRSRWVHTESCDRLAEAFVLVTGVAPLNDSEHYCK